MLVVPTREVRWSTDDLGRDVVERFTAEIIDDDDPDVKVALDVDVVDNRPVVVAVTVRKAKGVASRDIRIPVERYLQHVLQHPNPPPGFYDDRLYLPTQLARVTRRRRRVLTDGFLRAVTDAYVAGGRSIAGITPDVDARFHASESQKFRWIKAARERGILTDEED
jgi:hypothetical protein